MYLPKICEKVFILLLNANEQTFLFDFNWKKNKNHPINQFVWNRNYYGEEMGKRKLINSFSVLLVSDGFERKLCLCFVETFISESFSKLQECSYYGSFISQSLMIFSQTTLWLRWRTSPCRAKPQHSLSKIKNWLPTTFAFHLNESQRMKQKPEKIFTDKTLPFRKTCSIDRSTNLDWKKKKIQKIVADEKLFLFYILLWSYLRGIIFHNHQHNR